MWLAIGLWVLLMPASVGARPLARASPFAAAFLLAWLLAAYTATSVAPIVKVAALAQCAVYPEPGGVAVWCQSGAINAVPATFRQRRFGMLYSLWLPAKQPTCSWMP